MTPVHLRIPFKQKDYYFDVYYIDGKRDSYHATQIFFCTLKGLIKTQTLKFPYCL